MKRRVFSQAGFVDSARTCVLTTLASALVSALLTAMLTGCAGTQAPAEKVALVSNSGWVSSQTIHGAVFEFDWELENPTQEPVTVRGVEWFLSVGADKNFTGTKAYNVIVEPGSHRKGVLRVEVDLPYSAQTLQYHLERGPLDYHMQADFELSSSNTVATYPEWHGKIFAPRAPRLIVEGGGEREQGAARLDFEVSLLNENPFDVEVDEIRYILRVAGKSVERGSLLDVPQTMPPTSELNFEINPKIAKRILRRVRNKMPFELQAVVITGKVEQHVPLKGVVDFTNY